MELCFIVNLYKPNLLNSNGIGFYAEGVTDKYLFNMFDTFSSNNFMKLLSFVIFPSGH